MRRFVLLIAFAWVATASAESGFDFWVWHRSQPLSVAERTALAKQGARTLYWHIGEMQNPAGRWQWKAPPRIVESGAKGLRVIPVIRLTSEARQPFSPDAVAALRDLLRAVPKPGGALQLDYDCPDRLLPEYAAALRTLRADIPHLRITALAHWPRLKGFEALAHSVEEIAPMFYDLQADPPGVGAGNPPPALLDPAQLESVLKAWKSCPTPWRAGLPSFARLTVFNSAGVSRGQIPNWHWDDFCFHRSLHTVAPTCSGVTLFRASAPTRVAATPIKKDEFVASRFTDRAALAKAITLAHEAGAAGIVLFRLPGETSPSGWSLVDLARADLTEHPRLILRQTAGEQLELVNNSSVDLPPRLSGPKSDRDRGYALEIDAPAPLFREALAGEFWRVGSHAQPDSGRPVPVAVPLATRLTFWFSHLPAGAALQTGLLQLAPAASLADVRYRVLNCAENDAWKLVIPPATDALD